MINPTKNFFAVVDIKTGQHLMHVIDAHDLTDIAWHPEGSIHVHVPLHHYKALSHHELYAHINEQLSLKNGIK